MKSFYCPCGQRVFFDSTSCVTCGRAIGFDPESREMVALSSAWRRCGNGLDYEVCNWVLPAADPARYCLACSLNDMIPNLDVPENIGLWSSLEAAKRRLLYTLRSLGLPLTSGSGGPALRFRFMEDRRRNPLVLEDFIGTGHWAGTITINIREADDVARTADREAMQERYRTLLGHFRHESGHYYFNLLVTADKLERWRQLFGDERADYAATLEAHYRNGPRSNWSLNYVSPYATAHPYEDWAETFAHYLHIVDALETARDAGFALASTGTRPGWILEWMRLSVTLNELNRSLGLEDPYPFVLTAPVIEKLEFIDHLVHPPGGFATGGQADAAVSQRLP